MARLESEYIEIHKAADKLEPKLARRAIRGLRRIRNQAPIIDDIALALSRQPPSNASKLVAELFPLAPMKKALQSMGPVTKQAFFKGGRLGATAVEDVLNNETPPDVDMSADAIRDKIDG